MRCTNSMAATTLDGVGSARRWRRVVLSASIALSVAFAPVVSAAETPHQADVEWATGLEEQITGAPTALETSPGQGRVVVPAGNSVVVLDLATGAETLRVPVFGEVAGAPAIARTNDGQVAIFVGTLAGRVYRIDPFAPAAAVAIRWEVTHQRPGCEDGFRAPPTVHLRRDASAAFRARYTTDLVYIATAQGGGSSCDGRATNRVLALDAETGSTRWVFNMTASVQMDQSVAPPVLDPGSDTLYVPTERTLSTSQPSLWALDVVDGTLRWSQNAGRLLSPPAVLGDRIYVGDATGRTLAFDRHDGSPIWQIAGTSARASVLAVDHPDLGALVGVRTLLSFTLIHDGGDDGEVLYRVETPIGTEPPTLDPSSHHVYLGGGLDGQVHQLELATGVVSTSRVLTSATSTLGHVHQPLVLAGRDLGQVVTSPRLLAVARDGNLAVFVIPWRQPSGPPVAVDDIFETTQGMPLEVVAPGVLSNDSHPDAHPLTAELVDEPGHGTLELAGDGSFVYLPASDFAGTDVFTYRASDGVEHSDPATVRIVVHPDDPDGPESPGAPGKPVWAPGKPPWAPGKPPWAPGTPSR